MSTLLRMDSIMRFNIQNTSQGQAENVQGGRAILQARAPVAAMPVAPNRVGTKDNQETKDANGNTKHLMANRFDRNECRSCKTRQYMDGSTDPGVSFKSPTNIPAGQSTAAVSAHESEHVSRNKAAAEAEGREVVSQSVVLHSAICPECGVSYTSGGETTTVTKAKNDPEAIQPRLDTKA